MYTHTGTLFIWLSRSFTGKTCKGNFSFSSRLQQWCFLIGIIIKDYLYELEKTMELGFHGVKVKTASDIDKMTPRDERDEKDMLHWAIELSKIDAEEDEERRRKMEQENEVPHPHFDPTSLVSRSATQVTTIKHLNSESDDSDASSVSNRSTPETRIVVFDKSLDDEVPMDPRFYTPRYIDKKERAGAEPDFDKITNLFGGWGLKKYNFDSAKKNLVVKKSPDLKPSTYDWLNYFDEFDSDTSEEDNSKSQDNFILGNRTDESSKRSLEKSVFFDPSNTEADKSSENFNSNEHLKKNAEKICVDNSIAIDAMKRNSQDKTVNSYSHQEKHAVAVCEPFTHSVQHFSDSGEKINRLNHSFSSSHPDVDASEKKCDHIPIHYSFYSNLGIDFSYDEIDAFSTSDSCILPILPPKPTSRQEQASISPSIASCQNIAATSSAINNQVSTTLAKSQIVKHMPTPCHPNPSTIQSAPSFSSQVVNPPLENISDAGKKSYTFSVPSDTCSDTLQVETAFGPVCYQDENTILRDFVYIDNESYIPPPKPCKSQIHCAAHKSSEKLYNESNLGAFNVVQVQRSNVSVISRESIYTCDKKNELIKNLYTTTVFNSEEDVKIFNPVTQETSVATSNVDLKNVPKVASQQYELSDNSLKECIPAQPAKTSSRSTCNKKHRQPTTESVAKLLCLKHTLLRK